MRKSKILAFSGGRRIRSNKLTILEFIAALYPELLDVEIYKSIVELPHFTRGYQMMFCRNL